MRLGELTGREAAAALSGHPVILLPLGSHESHGPDLPMGDYLAAERIAIGIAERAREGGVHCLVAPVLPFGGADYFGSAPGGIALGQSTLRAVLADMIDCLLRHGHDRLMVVNGHGGNAQAVHEVTLAVRRTRNVMIPSLYLWKVARMLMDQQLGPGAAAARAGHGADPVASVTMHLFGLARPEPAAAAAAGAVLGLAVSGFATARLDGVAIDLPLELDEIAPTGVAPGADPAQASAADGRRITERLIEIGAALAARLAQPSTPLAQPST